MHGKRVSCVVRGRKGTSEWVLFAIKFSFWCRALCELTRKKLWRDERENIRRNNAARAKHKRLYDVSSVFAYPHERQTRNIYELQYVLEKVAANRLFFSVLSFLSYLSLFHGSHTHFVHCMLRFATSIVYNIQSWNINGVYAIVSFTRERQKMSVLCDCVCTNPTEHEFAFISTIIIWLLSIFRQFSHK